MKSVKIVGLLLAGAFSVSGCAELTSIYRQNSIPNVDNKRAAIVTVDAKQRHTLVTNKGACAEAAPDVFTAIGTSASGQLNLTGGDQAASAGFSIAETAGVIGKTQTVNLIRESMYRTCERYISGAISERTFIVQAARDQRAMIALLAIEQLTGAERTRAAIISSPATQAAISNNADAIALSAKLRDDWIGYKEAAMKAEEEFKAADVEGECGDGQKAPEPDLDANGVDKNKEKIEKFEACKAKQTEWNAATSKANEAEKRLNLALAATSSASASAAAATGADLGKFASDGAPQQGQQGQQSQASGVADAVLKIATAPSVDEPLMFCLSYLDHSIERASSGRELGTDDLLDLTCGRILETRATSDNLTNRVMTSSEDTNSQPKLAQDSLTVKIFGNANDNSIATITDNLKAAQNENQLHRVSTVNTRLAYINALKTLLLETDPERIPEEIRKLGERLNAAESDIVFAASCSSVRDCWEKLDQVGYFVDGLSYFNPIEFFEELMKWDADERAQPVSPSETQVQSSQGSD